MVSSRIRIFILPFGLIAGCASYQALPLDTSPKMPTTLEQLEQDGSNLTELPVQWRKSKINIANGLSEDEIVQLSVLNNPNLKAVQSQIGDAKAQLKQAGLLVDPQLNLSADLPRNKSSNLVTAYGLGLGFDLQSLITRSSSENAATAAAKSTYLQVLWQEWQVVQQARILYRRTLLQQQQMNLAQAQFALTQENYHVQEDALRQNNGTLDASGLAKISMMDAQAAWLETQRQHNTTLHGLSLLIGLQTDGDIVFESPDSDAESLIPLPITEPVLQKGLANISKTRPDLLALQEGYKAQESRVRAEVLAQFPSFSIGANSLRDSGGAWTLGPFINMNLPILNGNRGNISIARATRERLKAEYYDRYMSTTNNVSQLVSDQRLAYDEWKTLDESLPALDTLMQKMKRALAGGNVDMLTYTTLQNSYFAQKLKVSILQQAVLEQAIAIETLLGTWSTQ